MKNFWNKLLVEDWVVVMLSIPLLLLCILGQHLPSISIPSNLLEADAWGKIAMLFLIAIVTLFAGNKLLSRPMKGMLLSFIVVFAIAAMAMWIGSNKYIKSELGLEPVFFSVIFGLIIRNALRVPDWMKPAIQGEFYIKIGVVCLGATILISDVMKSGVAGLLQACIIVTVVWLFAYTIARRIFKVERATAMTLSSGLTICGASAAIATAGVAGADKKSLSYIVSVVLIIAVPMIYLMPWLANMIVPLLSDSAEIQQEITGAWIGGTVDTTSGVAASSEMAGELAN
ncbi:MAG: putative sulfate exporter family transporter, partial [Alistipes sp.]|nr:putative sulfate exporter family transporter [Alistipes sp.]